MKVPSKIYKLIAIVATFALPSLYAADIFDPSSQPAGYAAPIVLSTNKLETNGGAIAYRPWFESGTYQGDLIEYDVDATGILSTSIDLSTSPPGNTGTNWSARVQLDAMNWDTDRKIITSNGTTQVAFRWGNLTTDQKIAIDSVAEGSAAASSDILDFLRGDRSNEFPTGTLRTRYSVMGDIMHGNPVYVGEPKKSYAFGDYGTFKLSNTNRAPRVYVGANDGMVHAFDAVTGNEVYAFIPGPLTLKMKSLSSNPYYHQYFVDGKLTEADVQIGGEWKTILVGGYGAGGNGYFALDITNPDLSSETANTGTDLKLLSESDGTDPDQGYSYSRPAIVKLNDGNWYVIYGNGYNSATGNAVLMMYNLETGTGFKIDTGNGSAATPNGLSSPVLVDTNSDDLADVAYAGDIDGNLWKFDLADTDPNNWGVSYGGAPLYAGASTQPILVQPDVSVHPTNVGLMVYFGTGRLLTLPEVNTDDVQAAYGIWDKGGATAPVPNLVTQTITETTFAAPSGTKRIRIISDNPIDWNTHTGWTVPLPAGERILARARFRAFRLQFTSINTLVDGGENWLNELRFSNGGPPPLVVFNLNEDGTLDDSDKSGGNIPGGLHLGTGVNSQLTFALVTAGIDTIIINNLSPPYDTTCTGSCVGGIKGGHIDVDTDSPAGDPVLYSIINDGSVGQGGNSDGHLHEYDEHNGITFVDFLNMGPRRGLNSLDVRSGNVFILPQTNNRVEEVKNADGSPAPIAGAKPFIVVLSNADLSPGGVLQLGVKEWNVKDYQDMIVRILQNGDPLVDDDGDSLIYTLDGIKAVNGTMRITFDDQVIIEGGLMPTVWTCPKGWQDPYNYTQASGHTWLATTTDLTGLDLNKHITKVPNGVANDPTPATQGYRWRNGTLVMQMLDASSYTPGVPGTSSFLLQDWLDLPRTSANVNSGGVHALAYTNPPSKTSGATMVANPLKSGLLYESFMFWHYGDLYEDLRVGSFAPCYGVGAAKWSSAVNIERNGLTLGEYQFLLNGLDENSQVVIDFFAALAAVDACLAATNCNEAQLNNRLQDLADASAADPDFQRYLYYRSYVGVLIPPGQVLPEDQPDSSPEPAKTPIVENTQVDNETQINGLNDTAGSRSWVDLTP